MMLDKVIQECANALLNMKLEEDINTIRKQAHNWWNFDIIPDNPTAVAIYIHDHPQEFKGVIPM